MMGTLAGLILIFVAALFFALGWFLCRQSQLDARNSARYANGRLLAANNMLMDATEREAQTAKRIESAAERFDEFREEHKALREQVSEQTKTLEKMAAGMTDTGVIPRSDGRRNVNPPTVRAFTGPRGKDIDSTGPPTPSNTLIT